MSKTYQDVLNDIKKGPYKDTWDSLSKKEMPKWFKQVKFGIFIHWGLYSVAAYNNEWYSRNMYIEGSDEFNHHIKTYGPHKKFGYQHFIDLFKAEKYDPTHWTKVIKNSKAKYVMAVAEHHEGFQMYKSDISKWNAFDMGPKRDLLKELQTSLEKEDILFCTSTHRAEHWSFMSHGLNFESDIKKDLVKGDFYWPSKPEQHHYDFKSEPAPDKEFLEDWVLRTVEMVDKFMPKLLYFDWWIQHQAFAPYLRKIAAYYYNKAYEKGIEVAICYKHDSMMFGTGIVEIERGKFADIKHFPWQTETSIANNSWCYTNNLDYKSTYEIIALLIDVVSKNGNLLLNIGPKGDGSIPEYEENLLKEVGQWLEINGEAIFDSKPYLTYGEGSTIDNEGRFSEQKGMYQTDDFRFTVNHGAIYVFALNPNADTFKIKHLKIATEHDKLGVFSVIDSIEQLGLKKEITYTHYTDFLTIKNETKAAMPIVYKINIK